VKQVLKFMFSGRKTRLAPKARLCTFSKPIREKPAAEALLLR
jgi:hypothetical protein